MCRYIIASMATMATICTPIVPLWANTDRAAISIDVSSGHSAIFAGQRTDFHCTVTVPRSFRGRLGWSLHVDDAVLARREAAVRANADAAIRVPISLDIPDAKPGVILPAVLSVSIIADGRQQAAASLQKRLWIFPDNPFHDHSAWLKRLDIRVFDPRGDTRRVFQTADIPFTRADNLDALAEFNGGVLIVGQGVSFDEYPGLASVMVAAAARGTAVLCLAPSEGRFVLPGSENGQSSRPTAITLRRADVIHEFDKRLDATFWPQDGRVSDGSFTIGCHRGQVVATVDASAENWSWLEARFSPGKGRLIVCSFDIVGKWETGPTPRFLFARLLKYLDQEDNLPTTKEKSDGT